MNKNCFRYTYMYICISMHLMLGFVWQMPLTAVTQYARTPIGIASDPSTNRVVVFQASDSNNNWFIMSSWDASAATQLSTAGRNAFKPFVINNSLSGSFNAYLCLWYEIDPVTNNNVLMSASSSSGTISAWQGTSQISSSTLNVTGDYTGVIVFDVGTYFFFVSYTAYDNSTGGIGAYEAQASATSGAASSWSNSFIGGS